EGPEAASAVPVEQFENANAAVIEASKASIELAKNGIVGFITSNWDIKQIEGVPAILESVRGGLQIIPLEEAAELISGCSRYISERLIREIVKPDWSELDRLADAISSIEYYIERLSEGASESDRFLEVARESLHKLGVTNGSDATTHISPHHISEAASEAPESVAKESDEQLIDQDILEIFAEEVEEVAADIEAATKVLQVDAANQEALAELRRAFHTLKGSGKLVGANAIADLAWVVEERLNKRIEQTIEIKAGELDVIDQIRQNMAPLLEAFSKGQDSNLSQSLA
ncbi:Hpt domain-containing protein, partial [Oleiphilus sp. HI0125]